MERTKTYRVQEFARLAGVTVRTLHYYEEAGLLTPSSRTSSGHRRYRQSDLLRLQQILTLKYLGFALDEIQALLAAPAYDLATALQAQKAALEGQILRLQQVVYALTRVSTALEQAQTLDWDEVIAIIRGLSEADRNAWLSRYFPPDQWAWLQERAAAMPPDAIAQGTNAWQELYESAAIDGAGAWQRLRHITLPLIRNTTMFISVLLTIGAFQVFISVYLMTKGGPLSRTEVLLTYMYKNAFEFLDLGYGAALSYLFAIMIFCLSLIQIRLLRRQVEY
jgi:DNA-binding transcriptional MerR regulator